MKTWYYYTTSDDGKNYFHTSEGLLEFLQNNDPSECGADSLTEEEWMEIQDMDQSYDESVSTEGEV